MFEELLERLEDLEAEALLGIDADLLEDVVLGLVTLLGLDDVGGDGALDEEAGLALEDLFAEGAVEREAEGLALLLGIGLALEGREVFLLLVGDVDLDAKAGEDLDDLLGLAGPHQAVVDEDRLELGAEGPVGQNGAGGAVDAAGQGRDGLAVADRALDLLDLGLDELLDVHGGSLLSVGPSYQSAPAKDKRRRDQVFAPNRRVNNTREDLVPSCFASPGRFRLR